MVHCHIQFAAKVSHYTSACWCFVLGDLKAVPVCEWTSRLKCLATSHTSGELSPKGLTKPSFFNLYYRQKIFTSHFWHCTSLVTRILAQETQFLLSHHARNGSIITHLCLGEYNQVSKYQRRLHFIGLHILACSYWVNISPPHGKAKSTFKRTAFDKIGSCCNACMWTGYFLCYWSRTTPRASQKKA